MFRKICVLTVLIMPYAMYSSASQGSDRATITRAEPGGVRNEQNARKLFESNFELAVLSDDIARVRQLCVEHEDTFTAIKRDTSAEFIRYFNALLSTAAYRKNLGMLQMLVDLGIRYRAEAENDCSFVSCGGRIYLIIKKGPEPRLMLQNMVHENNVDMARALLAAGSNINLINDDMIHFAVSPDMIELLHGAGADVNHRFGSGETVLLGRLRRLQGPYQSSQEVLMAYDNMEKLCQLGADVNLGDNECQTPLHFAANSNRPYPEAVRLFLARGARPDACNVVGARPFHVASSPGRPCYQKNNRAVLRLLHAHQIDSNY